MRTDSRLTPLVAVVLLVATGAAAPAWSSRPEDSSRRDHRARESAGFTVSGIYGGVEDGRIKIGDADYAVGPDLQAFVVGQGPQPLDSVPVGSRVSAWGGDARGEETILLVIVRPPEDAPGAGSEEDMSTYIRLKDEDEPR